MLLIWVCVLGSIASLISALRDRSRGKPWAAVALAFHVGALLLFHPFLYLMFEYIVIRDTPLLDLTFAALLLSATLLPCVPSVVAAWMTRGESMDKETLLAAILSTTSTLTSGWQLLSAARIYV